MLHRADFYFFSPTGGTRKAGEAFAKAAAEEITEINLGCIQESYEGNRDSELAVIAVPVFGGRIPVTAAERIGKIEGAGKKAVTLVVYGTRAYEDALLELNDLAARQGFRIVASGALVAQHSIVPLVGAGRPDARDVEEIRGFAEKVSGKLAAGGAGVAAVPGNRPYREFKQSPAAPVLLEGCISCGKCIQVCPTGAIARQGEAIVTDPGKCILCMACIANCPEKARILPPQMQEQLNQKLGALAGVRRDNEYFL